MAWNHSARPGDHRVITTDVWRNAFYAGEAPTFALTAGAEVAAWEVRNYYGDIVATALGDVSTSMTLPVLPLGFYTLYLTRATPAASPWLHSAGEIRFCVIRPGGPMMARPPLVTSRATDVVTAGVDVPSRAMTGFGPHRLEYTYGENWRNLLDGAVADAQYHASMYPTDPHRPYRHFAHTADSYKPYTQTEPEATNTRNRLAAAVTELAAEGITHFEGWNEPNNFSSTAESFAEQLTYFSDDVHTANPAAQVLGPCSISITPDRSRLRWTRDVLALAGDKVDVISFHNYNGVEGDLIHGRRIMDGFVGMLTSIGQQHKERINTEAFSYFQAVYGSYEPRLQAQWTMLDMHLMEQYGVPKENTSYFYDLSHGFWSYPSFWITNNAGEPHTGPLFPVVRVWSEELHGKQFAERLDFGTIDNGDFLGSRFTNPETGESVVAVQSDGRDGMVRFLVDGATTVDVVGPFGDVAPATADGAGLLAVAVSTLPVYLRLPTGVTATPEAVDYGVEAIRDQGALVTADSAGNGPEKIINGILENDRGDGVYEYRADPEDVMPSWVRLDFHTVRRLDRIRIDCPRPWQWSSAILDADVELLVDGIWDVIGTISNTESAERTFQWSSAAASGGCFTESYWNRTFKWVFELPGPVEATALRLSVRAVSHGGGATLDVTNGAGVAGGACGQTGPAVLTLREIRGYLSSESGSGVDADYAGKFVITG